MNYNTILVEQEEGIAVVRINRPLAMNALNEEVLVELLAALKELDQDVNVRAVVLTGEGKAFVAGADIKAMLSMNTMEARKFGETGQAVMNFLGKIEKPVLAAVNGFALGGGMELAMACDFIYAAENAKFGQPEINLGIIPGFGGTQRLSRLVGKAWAKELIFTGGMLSAQEAKEIGIVNRVFPAEALLGEVKKVAALIASKGALSVRLAKSAIDGGSNIDLMSGCTLERESFALCFSHQDQKEGMSAFLEKRKPAFTSS